MDFSITTHHAHSRIIDKYIYRTDAVFRRTWTDAEKLLKEKYFFSILSFVFLSDFTAAGVVPCGGRKTSPRTSTIVQFIFYFGPLRSAIIF